MSPLRSSSEPAPAVLARPGSSATPAAAPAAVSTTRSTAAPPLPEPALSMTGRRTALFAVTVGVLAIHLVSAQPLLGVFNAAFHLAPGRAALAVVLTMAGYATGMVLLTPLTDLVENRRLVLVTLGAAALAQLGAALAPSWWVLLAALYLVGVTMSAIQMLVTIAGHLAPETQRGRVLGDIMSGITLGILVSRPAASLLADAVGWRAIYASTAALLAALAVLFARAAPSRAPQPGATYGSLLRSLATLVREEPVLRRRALYAALAMTAFNLFWTAVALRLAAAPFALGARGIALFALAGGAGAVASPLVGRAGDRGWTRPVTVLCHGAVVLAMALAGVAGGGLRGLFAPEASPGVALGLLAFSGVLLDSGVLGDQTLGRRAVNHLRPEARGRFNGLFTGTFFVGAAVGSAVAGVAWARGGWWAVCGAGMAAGALALAAFCAAELRGRRGE